MSPKIIFVEALTPNTTAFGEGAHGRSLGLDEILKEGPHKEDKCPFQKMQQRACTHRQQGPMPGPFVSPPSIVRTQ